jgi:glucokinase
MDLEVQPLREREVLVRVAPEGSYVPYEHIVSGPGLLTLYRTLSGLDGVRSSLATPEAVTAAARARVDRQAVEAVDMFCAVLGSFVGNLAMLFMARGGVYLAGGFLSSIFDLLRQSRFAERFVHERSVREFLTRVPVRVIEHGQYGLLGAARWYLERLSRNQPQAGRVAACGMAG